MGPLKEMVVDEAFIAAMDKERAGTPGKGMIAEASENFPYFCEKMLGLRLYAWQVYAWTRARAALLEKDPEKRNRLIRQYLLFTGRQQGKSTFVAAISLWACVFNKLPGKSDHRTSVLVVSATDKQATELLLKVKDLMLLGDDFMERTYLDTAGNPVFGKRSEKFKGFFSSLLDEGTGNSASSITFKRQKAEVHGQYILAGAVLGPVLKSYPPTGKVLGQTGCLILEDECGMADNFSDDTHYKHLAPTAKANAAIRFYSSTPWFARGFFYELCNVDGTLDNPHIDRVMFTCESIKIENPSQYQSIQEDIEELRKAGRYNEALLNYYCQFVKGETAYFEPEAVKRIFSDGYGKFDAYAKKCDMGIDFGGEKLSHTTVTISEMDEKTGMMTRLYHHRYPINGDGSLLEDIADLLKKFNVQRIVPDDCPAGWYRINAMRDRGWNVEPMKFATDKVKKYGAFRAALNRGEIRSYVDDELKKEMLGMQFSQGKVHTIIEHAPGGTDDLIDGFVMSLYFFLQEETNRVRFVTFEW
jgi:hypothetical protein